MASNIPPPPTVKLDDKAHFASLTITGSTENLVPLGSVCSGKDSVVLGFLMIQKGSEKNLSYTVEHPEFHSPCYADA